MEKKHLIISCVFSLFIFMGVLGFHYFDDRDPQITTVGLPEGYEQESGRVEKLRIDGSVSQYYDENIDLVAFGPGSGWLKFKTRDGLSPMLSFDEVSQDDVVKFNRFSKQIGLPIKVAYSNKVLRISSTEKTDESMMMADITAEKLGKNSIMVRGMRDDMPSRLVLRKDKNGKVFLVKADDKEKMPIDKMPEKDIVVAKKD